MLRTLTQFFAGDSLTWHERRVPTWLRCIVRMRVGALVRITRILTHAAWSIHWVKGKSFDSCYDCFLCMHMPTAHLHTLYVLYRMSYVVHRMSYMVHRMSYVHRTSYVVHRMWYIICRMWYIVCRTSYIVCGTSYVVCGISYVVHRTSYVVCRTSYVVCRTSYVVCGTAKVVQCM